MITMKREAPPSPEIVKLIDMWNSYNILEKTVVEEKVSKSIDSCMGLTDTPKLGGNIDYLPTL